MRIACRIVQKQDSTAVLLFLHCIKCCQSFLQDMKYHPCFMLDLQNTGCFFMFLSVYLKHHSFLNLPKPEISQSLHSWKYWGKLIILSFESFPLEYLSPFKQRDLLGDASENSPFSSPIVVSFGPYPSITEDMSAAQFATGYP